MEFYRAEILIENLKNFNEEEEGRRKETEKDHDTRGVSDQASRMMTDVKRNMPSFSASKGMSDFKMPKLPDFKI